MRLFVLLGLAFVPGAARHRRSGSPALKLSCPKGRLPHISCTCSATFVRCINAQLRDADIFQDIAARFPCIKEISVNGNSLMGLDAPIFASAEGKDLRHLHKLLIPNNYLVELTPDVFRFAPNLHSLDLSFNEIKLSASRRGFLVPLPRLRHLILRKGFSRPLKTDLESTSRQLSLLEQEFRAANLTELGELDLSINFLRYIPVGFGCALAGVLRSLSLDGNELRGLSEANMTCLADLHSLSLRQNLFAAFAAPTRLALSLFGRKTVSVSGNKVHCDCTATAAIAWVQSANASALADADELSCGNWGDGMGGRPLLSLPAKDLVCASGAPPRTQPAWLLLLATPVLRRWGVRVPDF